MYPTEENLSKKQICNICHKNKEIREFTRARNNKFTLKESCVKCARYEGYLKFKNNNPAKINRCTPEYQKEYRKKLKNDPEKYESFLEKRRISNRKYYNARVKQIVFR